MTQIDHLGRAPLEGGGVVRVVGGGALVDGVDEGGVARHDIALTFGNRGHLSSVACRRRRLPFKEAGRVVAEPVVAAVRVARERPYGGDQQLKRDGRETRGKEQEQLELKVGKIEKSVPSLVVWKAGMSEMWISIFVIHRTNNPPIFFRTC